MEGDKLSAIFTVATLTRRSDARARRYYNFVSGLVTIVGSRSEFVISWNNTSDCLRNNTRKISFSALNRLFYFIFFLFGDAAYRVLYKTHYCSYYSSSVCFRQNHEMVRIRCIFIINVIECVLRFLIFDFYTLSFTFDKIIFII